MNSAPRGWYVDPSTGTNLRFWNGNTWTDEVAPLPPEATPSGRIDPVGSIATATATAQGREQPDEPVPSDPPVPASAMDGSWEGGLDPDLEHTFLTRRELRARRGGEAAPDDAPKHLSPITPPPAPSTESRLEPVEVLEIPVMSAPDEVAADEVEPIEPVEPVEQVEPEGDPGRTRRIMRVSVLLGVLAVVSSVAVLTAGAL